MPCVAVSLDIQSAFNRAWWPAVFSRLRDIGCPQNIFRLVNDYLHDRKVALHYAGATASRDMRRGCIQGSACGPALWNLILDDLLGLALPSGCRIQAYADDVLLVVGAGDELALRDAACSALDQIYNWGQSFKLVFGPSKTQALAFSPRAARIRLTMAGVAVPFADQIKLLGIIIDKTLSFAPHVEHIVQTAGKIYNRLALFARPTWGLHPANVDSIYRYVIVPIVTYAAGVWGHVVRHRVHAGKLLALQRGFALKATRAYRTVSTNASLAWARFTPLDLEVLRVAEVERTRVRRTTRVLPDDLTLESPVGIEELLHPAHRISPQICTAISPDAVSSACRGDTVQIYTDGSKQENGAVGAAVVCVDLDARPTVLTRRFKLHDVCTVFQAEAFAILQACRLASLRGYRDALICSDSLSVLTALERRSTVAPILTAIHRIVHEHSPVGEIRFCWVKGHAAIPGNVRADMEAGAAAVMRTAPNYCHFPMSYVKGILRTEAHQAWQTRYEEAPQGSQTKRLFPALADLLRFRALAPMSFQLTQFVSGHGAHLSYLHRFKISTTYACPCDGSSAQDPWHLLVHCPRFAAKRLEHDILCGLRGVEPFDFVALGGKDELVQSVVRLIVYIYDQIKSFNSGAQLDQP
ncbi:uncharacterized protein LOC114358048 [Ostrinia furnacalis]|uniref:uncharacterized protein LOC114358048 n=1 Tax=Ostrinia furnacalis TaxID=93504 RepID=UPI00103C51A9|nr:uncharacterized protein LOC114358048 [Ostrinia furnacalis]